MKELRIQAIDDVLKSKYKKITPAFKDSFKASMIVGLIAHMYMFTNKLPNYDDIGLNGIGATFRLGRWFLWFLGAVANHLELLYSIPWINGLFTIFMIALSAGIVSEVLQIKSKVANFMVGAFMVAFPSWTATMFFMFTAPYYGLALFMACLSIFLAWQCNNRKWHMIAPLFLACSLGIYQAYITFVATLYVILLIMKLVEERENWIKVIRDTVYCLVQLLVAGVIYYLIMKLSLYLTHQELASYKGMDSMGSLSIEGIQNFINTILTDFFGIFLNNNLELSYSIILKGMYSILFIISTVLLMKLFYGLVIGKKYSLAIELVVFVIAYVISINSIYLLCQDGVYSLVRFAYVCLIIFPICLIDRTRCNTRNIMEWILMISLFVGIGSYCHYANGQYLSIQLSFDQAYSYYNTIITQVKSLDGYHTDMPVTFVGYGNISDESLYKNEVMEVFNISGRDDILAQTYNLGDFLRYYCGFDVEFIDIDVEKYPEIVQMEIYPEKNSIGIVENMVVVKLAEN